MKSFFALIFVCLLGVDAQNSCQNYYNQPGTCVLITSCKSLKDIDEKPTKTYWDRLILNGNICGTEGTTKKVCCTNSELNNGPASADRAPFGGVNVPINDPDSIPWTNARPTTTETTTVEDVVTRRTTTASSVSSSRPNTETSNNLLPEPGNSNCGLHSPDKVYGGSVTAIDEHPWLARLEYTYSDDSKDFRCGGALINSRYVLTAAHCLPKPEDKDVTLSGVRLGEWNAATTNDCFHNSCTDPPQDIRIEEIIAHPNFVPGDRDYYHDIALLRLATPAKFSTFVRALCLPSKPELRSVTDFNGKKFTVSGWGETETATRSDLKLKVDLNGVGKDTCNWIWRHKENPITEKQICAGGEEGKDTCGGDSGGPLILSYSDGAGTNYNYAAGIVSYGLATCAQHNWPGVYTNVGAYMDWIEQNIRA